MPQHNVFDRSPIEKRGLWCFCFVLFCCRPPIPLCSIFIFHFISFHSVWLIALLASSVVVVDVDIGDYSQGSVLVVETLCHILGTIR